MARYRELGIVGHLPAFGGYAPWDLGQVSPDEARSGATRGICPNKDCDTAWIDGRDPLYTEVADAWMKQIIADFGSDHAWQMDAFCDATIPFGRRIRFLSSDKRWCEQLETVPAGVLMR